MSRISAWDGVDCLHLKRNRIWSLARLIGLLMPEEFALVEIGVYQGDMPAHLGRLFPRMHYTGVDPYCRPDIQAEVDERRRIAEERVAALPIPGRILAMTSEEAVGQFATGSLDMVYIDGDHAYEAVVHDVLQWYGRVREGGVLCGHDYYPGLSSADRPLSPGCKALEDVMEAMGLEFVSDWPYSANWSLVKGADMSEFQKEQ